MAEVGEAKPLGSALAGQLVLRVGGVQQAVQTGVVGEGAGPTCYNIKLN